MREKTLSYLLDEIPKLRKLFGTADDKPSFDTLVLISIMVEKLDEIIELMNYPTKLEE